MKTTALMFTLAFPAALLLTACSSTPKLDETAAVKDQRLATNFTDQGVKVFYTLTGKLEKIEVTGQADAWKGNVELQAEADAYAKMVKFIYGSDVSQERKLKIIGRAIENARDQSLDRSTMVDGTIMTNDQEIEIDERSLKADAKADDKAGSSRKPGTERSKSAQRVAKVLNETILETVTTLTAAGRLTGMRKVRDSVVNQGKTYVATYEWNERDQATLESVRARMNNRINP